MTINERTSLFGFGLPHQQPIILISLVTIASGILVLLGWFVLPVRITLLVGIITLFAYRRRAQFRDIIGRMADYHPSWLVTAIGCAAIASAIILRMNGTTSPIRSPWSVVAAPFFLFFAAIAISATRSRLGTSVALFVSSLVAILVYPIGFGFDHFIHVAAEQLIASQGALTPAPLFYSGFYGLVGLLATIPGITVAFADRLIVPLFVAIAVVPFIQRSFCVLTPNRATTIAVSSLIIVPFLPFAVSTPQALANAFALVTIILLVTQAPRHITLLATAATLLAQPLTGIPIAITVVAAWLIAYGRRTIGIAAAISGVIAIPIAFAIAQIISPQLDIRTSFAIELVFKRLWMSVANTFSSTVVDFSHADLLSVVQIIIPLLWIALAATGVVVLYRQRRPIAPFILGPLIAIGSSITVAVTITTASQLSEEQSQFPLRLLALGILLAMPLVGYALVDLFKLIKNNATRIAVTFVFSVVATTNLVLAYPRDDAQERSGLWSVSADDILAVHTIALDAGDRRYVVLANQMLGAAAIQEFGFRPSTITDHGEILSFPLPAGGPVAQQFWSYVGMQTPTRAPIDATIKLVNADRAYVVLHDYWRNYNQLVPATKTIADSEITPDPSLHLRIFSFDKQNTPTP